MQAESNTPGGILLVQGTGGGKSCVMQTIEIINAGITLIIENTLSLGADQVSKIKECGQDYGSINGFQLDLIKKKEKRDVLVKF